MAMADKDTPICETELLLPFGEFRMCGSQHYGPPLEKITNVLRRFL
jgi:hypothetical protein